MLMFEHYVVALLQLAPLAEGTGGFSGDLIGLVARSSLASQLVLTILLFFSIGSWAIILFKLREFRRVEAQTAKFVEVFRRSGRFSDVQSVCKSLSASPLVGVFQAGYVELNTQLKNGKPRGDVAEDDANERRVLQSFEALDRVLLRASSAEINRLEKHVPVLATTASITPFIGLLGTVWGIILAFQGIGSTGSTSLAVVAPPIAEALLATAAGLFAAIPAVYFYNHLTTRIKLVASAVDDFSLEFLNIAERNFSG